RNRQGINGKLTDINGEINALKMIWLIIRQLHVTKFFRGSYTLKRPKNTENICTFGKKVVPLRTVCN
ncbi:MAG: hypothetical protein ACI4TV_00670, partial [Paludibacteraceae bacterium]